jgi:hypothetical protein
VTPTISASPLKRQGFILTLARMVTCRVDV